MILKTFKLRSHPSPGSPEPEGGMTAVVRGHQTLAAESQRFRAETEQTGSGSEEIGKIVALEAAHQEAVSARVGQVKQLADLERRIVKLEAERHQSLGQIESIETSLTDTLSRLDTIDNQVRAFHRQESGTGEGVRGFTVSRHHPPEYDRHPTRGIAGIPHRSSTWQSSHRWLIPRHAWRQ